MATSLMAAAALIRHLYGRSSAKEAVIVNSLMEFDDGGTIDEDPEDAEQAEIYLGRASRASVKTCGLPVVRIGKRQRKLVVAEG